MTSEAGLDVLLKGLYEEDGPATEDADLMCVFLVKLYSILPAPFKVS